MKIHDPQGKRTSPYLVRQNFFLSLRFKLNVPRAQFLTCTYVTSVVGWCPRVISAGVHLNWLDIHRDNWLRNKWKNFKKPKPEQNEKTKVFRPWIKNIGSTMKKSMDFVHFWKKSQNNLVNRTVCGLKNPWIGQIHENPWSTRKTNEPLFSATKFLFIPQV